MLGVDDRLAFRATYGSFTDEDSDPFWYVEHERVWDDDDGDWFGCLPFKFARMVDAERAIKALREAGMDTARKMWSQMDERKRIVAEAMAW